MAFTGVRVGSQLWEYFSFFATGKADGGPIESISGSDFGTLKHFIITEIRLTLSSKFLSVEDFVVKLSAAIAGSDYKHTFISQAMSDLLYYRWAGSALFVSGDTLGFLMSMDSASNAWGLEVQGWAINY